MSLHMVGRRTSEVGRINAGSAGGSPAWCVNTVAGRPVGGGFDLAPTLLRGSQRRCIPTRSMGTRALSVGRHVGANSFAIEAGQRPAFPVQEAWA
jgi:hypothetical protein